MHRITGRAEPSIGQLGGRGIFFFPARVCPVTTSHRLIQLAAKWLNIFGQTETLQNFNQI